MKKIQFTERFLSFKKGDIREISFEKANQIISLGKAKEFKEVEETKELKLKDKKTK